MPNHRHSRCRHPASNNPSCDVRLPKSYTSRSAGAGGPEPGGSATRYLSWRDSGKARTQAARGRLWAADENRRPEIRRTSAMADSLVEELPVRFGGVVVRTPIELADIEAYRRELTGYCYRMLGSGFDAEDAVQDTLVRAWRASNDSKAAPRAVLAVPDRHQRVHRHAAEQPRARPVDLGPASPPAESLLGRCWPRAPGCRRSRRPGCAAGARTRPSWPRPGRRSGSPSWPRCSSCPRQRAVLILCEVLRWQAAETAELLDTTVAAVNSALQRARATLGAGADDAPGGCSRRRHRAARAVRRRIRALRHRRLVTLLRDDAVQSMPPLPCGCGARPTSDVDARSGPRLPGLAPAAHFGQRLPGVRAVPRTRPGATRLGAAGARDLG